MFRSLLASI